MLRALFFRELRRSWLGHAGFVVVLTGTLIVMDAFIFHFQPSVDRQLFMVLMASSLVSGERTFSRRFREGRFGFLAALPVPRDRVLMALAGARLLGATLALPMVFAVRPSIISSWLPSLVSPESIPWVVLVWCGLTVYSTFFLLGACLALAFQKQISLYLVGIPVLVSVWTYLIMFASYGFLNPQSVLAEKRYLLNVSYCFLLLGLLMALACRRAFCRGEFHIRRRRWRSLTEIGIALVVCLGTLSVLFSSTSVAALTDPWTSPAPGSALSLYGPESPVSPNGKYLFLVQRLPSRPAFTRLAVVDLRSGKSTDWMERQDIYRVVWSAAGDFLNVLAANHTPSDFMMAGGGFASTEVTAPVTTDWYRLTPDLRVLSRHRFDRTWNLHSLGDGHLLLTSERSSIDVQVNLPQKKHENRVYWLSEANGSIRTSFEERIAISQEEWRKNLPLAGLWRLDQGVVLASRTSSGIKAIWLDQEGGVVRQATHPGSEFPMYLLDGGRIATPQEAESEWRQRFLSSAVRLPPELRDRSASLRPFLPVHGGSLGFYSVSSSPGTFFVEHRARWVDIWRLDRQHGTWARILSGVSSQDFREWAQSRQEQRFYQLAHLRHQTSFYFEVRSQDEPRFSSPIDFDPSSGIWAAALGSGDGMLLLYDDRLGQTVPTTMGCGRGEKGEVALKSVNGLEGLLVQLTCPDKGGTGRPIHRFLAYRPGSGRLRELPWHSAAVPPKLFDRWLYLNPDGFSIWMSKTGEVWQVGSGRKPLRLGPPEARSEARETRRDGTT